MKIDNLGIVLLNMGGPTSLDAVRPFLQNLFNDREIISFGPMEFARRPLAWLIAKVRSKTVVQNYAMIGGKSPIAELSWDQAKALESALAGRYGTALRVRVEVGFSYWHPFIHEAMENLHRARFTHVFLMPLYPHYSKTTSGSCFKTWRDLHRERGNHAFKVKSVKAYPRHAEYIAAIDARIDEGLRLFPEERRRNVTLLFSAHGTPVSFVEEGDPYSHQIRETMEAVMDVRGRDLPYHLSFQSKVGPAKWLEPNTVAKTVELASTGVRDLLVIPIAFVTEHIETLHELNIELRKEATHAGIENFHVMPALNDHPGYIKALADQIIERMERGEKISDHG